MYNISIKKSAPIVMEYYDRYRESEKSSEHEGVFLDDWEIIYSADLYQMIIDYSYDFYKKNKKTFHFVMQKFKIKGNNLHN